MLNPDLQHHHGILRQVAEALELALHAMANAHLGLPIPDDAISAVEAAIARLEKTPSSATTPQTPAPPPGQRQP